MFAIMTSKEIYREYLQQLRQIYNASEAAVITDWVIEKVAGLQRFDIIKSPGQAINPEISRQLNDCLSALLRHKPVQYVLGEAWFYKMRLTVDENVLIPRPETEELVQLVIDDWGAGKCKDQSAINNPELLLSTSIREANTNSSILDIGTGSGCIAIAVKRGLPAASMLAIDISAGAISVARENALHQQADIQFLQLDFLDENTWKGMPMFDVIVSNPPYIPINEKDNLDKNVTAFEPHTALFVPYKTPLLFYEKIAAFGKTHLRANGKIYVEIHEDFGKETMEVFDKAYRVEIRKDMFGKERMLIAANHFIN